MSSNSNNDVLVGVKAMHVMYKIVLEYGYGSSSTASVCLDGLAKEIEKAMQIDSKKTEEWCRHNDIAVPKEEEEEKSDY